MRFFQRRREKDADWLQQMEGNWSDRHGSCYEVSRDAAYKGTSYSCSVRIQRPSGEAFSRPAVIKQVEDGTIIWGQKYILDETHSTHDSLSWKNLRGYSGFSWQRMKPRASAPKAADVQGGEDCRVHPAPPPPPPPAEKPQDAGHKDPAPRLGWTPTWTRRSLPKQVEKEEKEEKVEEDQDLYLELAATEDTSEPSADAEAKQVATTDHSSLETDDSGDPAKVEDAWEGSHAAHIPNKHWNNRARVAWDASDTAEEVQAHESKSFPWRSSLSGQSHPQPVENKPQSQSKGTFFWRQKMPTPPPPPPPAKSPDLTDDSRSEKISEQIVGTPSAQEEEPKLALTGNVSVAADGTAIYEGDIDAFDEDTNRGTIYSRGASADYDGDAMYVPGGLLGSRQAAVKDSVCFSVRTNEDGELVAETLLRLKASGSDHFALSGTYKTASGHLAGIVECAEVRKLFDFDVQVSHEVADRGLFLTGQEVEFNARFVLMADLSGQLEATELRLVEDALQQPERERLSEEMPATALAPFDDPKLGAAANPEAVQIPDRELWRKELDRLIWNEDIIHL